MINQEKFDKARQCLIDNGIDKDEADTVLQALCYILCDEETEQCFPPEEEVGDRCIITLVTIPNRAGHMLFRMYEGFLHEEDAREIATNADIKHKTYEIDVEGSPNNLPDIVQLRNLFSHNPTFERFEKEVNQLGFNIKEYK